MDSTLRSKQKKCDIMYATLQRNDGRNFGNSANDRSAYLELYINQKRTEIIGEIFEPMGKAKEALRKTDDVSELGQLNSRIG